ncbi:MAG: acetamidase/formamidase family protein [Sphingomonadales bacterium]
MKRKVIGAMLASCLFAAPAFAGPSTEQWIVKTDFWGNPTYQTLTVTWDNGRLTGDLDGDAVTGTRTGRAIAFTATGSDKDLYVFRGTVEGDRLAGSADMPDTNTSGARATHSFTARAVPHRPAGPPQRHEFKPSDYSNSFDPHRPPVLTIWPGDSVHTTTIDSGGVDETGKTRALYGNPQTGPFQVAGARAGDTLAVKIIRLRLNRNYADSLDMVVRRAQTTSVASKAMGLGKPVRWALDLTTGLARPEGATGGLKGLSIPARPMLGGLAVAPGNGSPPVSTGDTGSFGGNMDFNEVVEGNTVYLPVQQPGALLYLGDAHALQGDGETSQYALETSMDVEFSVEIIRGKQIAMPRVESPSQIMVLGQAGSLDDATRAATSGMIDWLAQGYGLTLSESAQLLGSAARYRIANLAGRSVGVAAKIDKVFLPKPL